MIEVHGLTYRYTGGENPALTDVNISFPAEHIVALLGQSGSGKTTLLKCVGRFLEPTAGRVTLDDVDVRDLPELEFRRQLGLVFQRLFLFPHMTVLENMTLAPVKALEKDRAEAEGDAQAMLDRLDIGDLAERYPAQISGGQAQRAAIARGLMLQPEYMLLDEPTSALDAGTTDDFAKWLRELRSDTHFVIVTHDILFARAVATYGVLLVEGHVEESGGLDAIVKTARNGS